MTHPRLSIGIDQSLTNSALIAVDMNGDVINSDVIKPTCRGGERYQWILQAVNHFFMKTSEMGSIDVVIREHHAFGSDYNREAMGAAAAMVDLAVWQFFRKDPITIAPQTLKKFAQAQKKDQIRLAIYKKWGKEFRSNDECDAYVLGRIGVGLYVGSTLKYEQEVLAKLSENEWVTEQAQKTTSSGSVRHPARKQLRRPSATPSTTTAARSSGPSAQER